jgi:hypothetical protein
MIRGMEKMTNNDNQPQKTIMMNKLKQQWA